MIASSAPSCFSAITQSLDTVAVGAVRHQRADLSPLECRLCLADERKRGRWIKIDRRLVRGDFRSLSFHTNRSLDRKRQRFLNQREVAKHAAPDDRRFNLRKLEGERVLDVPLFGRRHGAIELSRLAIMIGEALRPEAQLLPCFALALLRGEGAKAALGISRGPDGSRLLGS